ncbi:MAG TPA: rod shape-determining protein MreD [Halieaceae bacterium]|uniref:rod shape-determining protein MreD n=1 Tax=Haliea salexigens TaxID=287487 RepID=UPI00040FB552|nr:rod shape-determining protein MreD [Haliea salexigens]MBK41582.1 rod shape-determining protein MreD [Haliea sp.]HBM82409.1 rod shape-determining protein MreD [Halieaceae bacterium]MBP70845.1 rod shape-determining protein MreD [Haliea sp.]HBQ39348.1 rod shape-determining protein MreD [Halieaceae bacterium]HCD54563.1 rod shape-determining protein MreD [Halieaceae bacterium]
MTAGNGVVFTVVVASFLVAALLAVVPLPEWLQWARPEWVALTLLYWCLALPHRVGIFTALLLGVLVDALEGAVLGQNAFSLTVLALCALLVYQRLRVFSLWQQCGVVFVVIGLHQLIGQWVQNLEGAGARSLLFLLPALSSALLWPVVLQVLRSVRRYYRIA